MSKSSNLFKKLLVQGNIDFSSDVFKFILMQPGFTFNQGTHEEYADVSGMEVDDGYGYTTGGVTLSGVSVTQDNTENRSVVTWNNASWTAAGGNIETGGAIIYDDTYTGDPVVGCINFGETITVVDGGTFTVSNIYMALLDANS